MCFLFLLENTATKKRKTTCYFDHQNGNSLCSHHHYINSSCQFCVSIESQKHEWKFGRTRNAVGTRLSRRRVFSQLFRVLPNFHECFYNSIETRRTCFLFLLQNTTTKKRKQLVNFDHENVNSLCSRHHYVDSSCQFCVSIELQKHDFSPISARIFLGRFSKCYYRQNRKQSPRNLSKYLPLQIVVFP